jgi:hypothetical protein
MDQTFSNDFDFSDMAGIDIHGLVASRLEDMADQVEYLVSVGRHKDAEMLRKEGLELADFCDGDNMFFYVNQSGFPLSSFD